MSSQRWRWRSPDDKELGKGFRGENFGGNHVREEFPVHELPGDVAIYAVPGLIARMYDDAEETWTLTEGEWRD